MVTDVCGTLHMIYRRFGVGSIVYPDEAIEVGMESDMDTGGAGDVVGFLLNLAEKLDEDSKSLACAAKEIGTLAVTVGNEQQKELEDRLKAKKLVKKKG